MLSFTSVPASTVVSKQGILAEVSDGGTLTINGNIAIDIQSRGAIECKMGINRKGGNLNIIDVKEIKCKNGPLIKATDSNVTISSVGTLKAQNGSILDLVSETAPVNVILSDVDTLSSTFTSIKASGNNKVLVNNIGSVLCNDSIFVNASASNVTSILGGGSITIQNIKSIPNTIRVYDHNLTLNNVKSIASSGGSGIDFNTSTPNKTGTYKLNITNTGRVQGLNYALVTKSSSVNVDGVQFVGGCLLTNSDVKATGCTFGGDLEIKDSFFEGRRITTLNVDVSDSSAKFCNSVLSGIFTSSNSAVDTYTSTLAASTHTTSSINMHNSKSSGTTTVNGGTNLMSLSSLLSTVSNNGGYVGIYGRAASGPITTTGNGMTFSGGNAGQTIDGKSIGNGISAPASTLYFVSNILGMTSIGDTSLTVGGDYTLVVTADINQTGSTVTWNQSGDVSLVSSSKIELTVGSNTVTVTGTSVTV